MKIIIRIFISVGFISAILSASDDAQHYLTVNTGVCTQQMLSTDGKTLIIVPVTGQKVKVFDIISNKWIHELNHGEDVLGFSLTANPNQLFTVSINKEDQFSYLNFWDLRYGQRVESTPLGTLVDAFSYDDNFVLLSNKQQGLSKGYTRVNDRWDDTGSNGTIKQFWFTETYKKILNQWVFNRNEKIDIFLQFKEKDSVRIFDTFANEQFRCENSNFQVAPVVSKDGVIATTVKKQSNQFIALRTFGTDIIRIIDANYWPITAMKFDKNGHLWTGQGNNNIRVWDVSTQGEIADYNFTAIPLLLTPTGTSIARMLVNLDNGDTVFLPLNSSL